MARTGTGVDVGLCTSEILRGQWKGNTFHVSHFAVATHRVEDPAAAWDALELDFKPTNARIGVTGREVNIRYTRVPRVPDWQLKNLMRFEVEEIGDQSGSGVASDFNLLPELPEIEGEDMVLLAMARESLLERHAEGLTAAGGKLDAFTPNAIALYNAYLRYGVVGDDTVLLANIGHDNVDVAIVRGPDLLFARNLTGGSRLFEDAIAQRFDVSAKKAEEIKVELATLRPNARYTDPNQEKASRALLGAAGQLLSLLQSTVLFCKSQVKISGLKIDRVLLCGGGAALDGLPEYLASGMSVPVELFDPFGVVDTSALDPEAAAELEEYRLESVVALGLATMASDATAYSVEILPESVRNRREFWGGQAFLYAAAILAVVYLGFSAWTTRSRLEDASAEAARLDRELRAAERTHRSTSELVAENERLAELALLLQGVAGQGEQVARTLETVEATMPEDFWLTELASAWTTSEALGVRRNFERPIATLEGKARQGTVSLSTSFEALTNALRGMESVVMEPKLSPTGTDFTVELCTLLPPRPKANADENAAEADGAGDDGTDG